MSTKPKIDPRKIQPENIPQELKSRKTWVNWFYYRRGKNQQITKPPIRFENGELRFAQIDNPKHFVSYEEGLSHANEKIGIGFVLTEPDPFVAIDVDHCFHNGELTQEAEEIVKLFNSYTEISPSGEGLRVFIKANEKPTAGGNRKGYFEQYSKDRYVTVTGNLTTHEIKEIQFRDEELKTYISKFTSNKKSMQEKGNLQHASSAENNPQKKELLNLQTQESFPQQKNSIKGEDMKKNSNTTAPSSSVKLTDEQIIKKASKKSKFLDLWTGATSNPDESSNDFSLLLELAFWTGKDPQQMERLFRRSELMRPKWDEKRGDTTYGQRSIQRAIEEAKTVYTGGMKNTGGGGKNNASNAQKIKTNSKEQRRKNKPHEYPNLVEVNEQGKRSVNIDLARDAVLESIPQHTLVHEEQFYQYKKGKWEIIEEEYMIRIIDKMIPKGLGKASITSEIFNHTKNRLIVRGENVKFNQHKNLFNFLNGNLNLKTGELEPHNPDLYQTVQFSFNFNPKAECPKFFQFLDDIGLSKKTAMNLQEWFGYIMYPAIKVEKCLYLFGEGANGKSTVLNAMKALVGKENMCSVQPTELKRFMIIKLLNKLVNFCSDVKSNQALDDDFKSIVSGESINADVKFGKPVELIPYAKHVFAGNNYFPIPDKSKGTWRRLDVIPFSKTIPEKEQKSNFFESELKQEMEGIINWAIQGLYRLMKNDWNFTQSEENLLALEEFKRASSPLMQFIEEECETEPEEEPKTEQEEESEIEGNKKVEKIRFKVEKTRFRDAYYDWCQENKYGAFTISRLTIEMKRLGYPLKKTSQRVGGKITTIRNYHGLKIKPVSEY